MSVATWFETVARGLDELEQAGRIVEWKSADVRGSAGFSVTLTTAAAVEFGLLGRSYVFDAVTGHETHELSPGQTCDVIEAAGLERPVIRAA